MIFLFLSLIQSSVNGVCDLFSFNADTCLSIYGCNYCAETQKCFSTFDNHGERNSACPNSIVAANSANGATGKLLGRCFALYSDDGCSKCVSNNDSVHCGWCQSMGVCAEGSRDGPFAFKCIAEDWLYNGTKCRSSKCAAAKSKDECREPCRWSGRRSVCFRPRDVNSNTVEKQRQEKEAAKTKTTFLVVAVLFAVVALVTVAATIWYATRPTYQSLPHMNSEYNLDDLPHPSVFN